MSRPGCATLALLALVAGRRSATCWRALVYGDLPPLPAFSARCRSCCSPSVEFGLAASSAPRLRGRCRAARRLHPLQVARAAVLAKASSAGGALLVGLLRRAARPRRCRRHRRRRADDRRVAVVALAASLLLVGAALLLERACRTPDDPDDRPGSAPVT